MFDRSGQGFFDGPMTVPKSLLKCAQADSKMIRPFPHGFGLTAVSEFCDKSRGSAILRLFIASCPNAVVRRVWAVAVLFAFKGMVFSGFWSHVRQKILERLPSLTHFNSSAAIIRKAWIFRVLASRDHSAPITVFRDFVKSVFGRKGASPFSLETAAALSQSAEKVIRAYGANQSAITLAIPEVARRRHLADEFDMGEAQDNPAMIAFAENVSVHNRDYYT